MPSQNGLTDFCQILYDNSTPQRHYVVELSRTKLPEQRDVSAHLYHGLSVGAYAAAAPLWSRQLS